MKSLQCCVVGIFVSLTNIYKTIFIKQTDVMMDGQRIQQQVNLLIDNAIFLLSFHLFADLKIIFTESCYKILEEKLSWENARSKCASLGYGSDLASVHTSQEKDFIRGN